MSYLSEIGSNRVLLIWLIELVVQLKNSIQTKESIKDFCVKKVDSILKSKQSQVWSLVEILENNQDHLDSLQIVSAFNSFED
jgi:hypothetical protein